LSSDIIDIEVDPEYRLLGFVGYKSLTSITFESSSNLSLVADCGALEVSNFETRGYVEVVRGMTITS
jgi:hypothetical protein